MCLGIPGEVVAIEADADAADDPMISGTVAFGGVRKRVCLAYVPEARVGDYVIVHAGFALSRIDPEEAGKVFDLLGQIAASIPPDEAPAGGGGP